MSKRQVLGEGKSIVQLVLPPTWVAQINALALSRGVNRSALIREAIAETLFADSLEGGDNRQHAASAPQTR
jgi:hypothetical protein